MAMRSSALAKPACTGECNHEPHPNNGVKTRDAVRFGESELSPCDSHYALAKHKPRKLKRLYDQRGAIIKALTREYFTGNKGVTMLDGSAPKF